MIIDARQLKSEELFIKLKEILASERHKDISIDVLLDTHQAAKRTMAFVSMTGCQTKVEGKKGYYVLRVTGCPCCV